MTPEPDRTHRHRIAAWWWARGLQDKAVVDEPKSTPACPGCLHPASWRCQIVRCAELSCDNTANLELLVQQRARIARIAQMEPTVLWLTNGLLHPHVDCVAAKEQLNDRRSKRVKDAACTYRALQSAAWTSSRRAQPQWHRSPHLANQPSTA